MKLFEKYIFLFLLLLFLLLFSGCPQGVQIESLNINPGYLELHVHDVGILKAAVFPAEADQSVTWSSSDSGIVSVDANGTVQALSRGQVIVTAKSIEDEAFISNSIVNVIEDVTSISVIVFPFNKELLIGETLLLNKLVSPSNVEQGVSWSSSNSSIADVSPEGLVTAKAAGTVVIKAVSNIDNKSFGNSVITVIDPGTQERLKITSDSVLMEINAVKMLDYEFIPSSLNYTVSWNSSNQNVVTVDNTGLLTAKGIGNATIYGTAIEDNSLFDVCHVYVVAETDAVTLTIAPSIFTLAIGGQVTLVPIVNPSSVSNEVIWQALNPGIATINSNGVVTAISEGEANFVAVLKASSSVIGTSVITVLPASVTPVPQTPAPSTPTPVSQTPTPSTPTPVPVTPSPVPPTPTRVPTPTPTPTPPLPTMVITITPASLSVPVGSKAFLSASVEPSNANQTVYWIYSPGAPTNLVNIDSLTGQITVNSTGLLGTTTIRAFSEDSYDIYKDCSVTVQSNLLSDNVPVNGDTTILQEAWYYFNGALGCFYDINWQDEGTGGFSGDIVVSAYRADKVTPYFLNSDTGTARIETLANESVFLKVSRNGVNGTFQLAAHIDETQVPDTWTFLLYFNCWELENSVINNIKEIVDSYSDDKGINIVLLVDKYESWENTVFTDTFTDTRLYTFSSTGLKRISGYPELSNITTTSTYEANMADPHTLADFITFGKKHYPAQNTAVIIQAHGFGIGGVSPDTIAANTDRLHPGELSKVLGPEHSVELLGFNGCQMGNIEFLYQFRNDGSGTRFTADYILGSPSTIHIVGWRYDWLFNRISATISGNTAANGETEAISGGPELIYKPSFIEPIDLARIIIEEQRDAMFSMGTIYGLTETLSCFDMTKVADVKEAVDTLVVSLTTDPLDSNNAGYIDTYKSNLETIRDDVNATNYYFVDITNQWEKTFFPLFELSDICLGIEADSNITASIKANALTLREAIDAFIPYSYYGDDNSNTKGLSIFFSIGDGIFASNPMFNFQWWYNALGRSNPNWPAVSDGMYDGDLDWCKDKYNNQSRPGFVDNWFELLDAWYDPNGNGSDGGINWYQF